VRYVPVHSAVSRSDVVIQIVDVGEEFLFDEIEDLSPPFFEALGPGAAGL
jgi:hypothetical protein